MLGCGRLLSELPARLSAENVLLGRMPTQGLRFVLAAIQELGRLRHKPVMSRNA